MLYNNLTEWINAPLSPKAKAIVDICVLFIQAADLELNIKATGELGECCILEEIQEDYICIFT